MDLPRVLTFAEMLKSGKITIFNVKNDKQKCCCLSDELFNARALKNMVTVKWAGEVQRKEYFGNFTRGIRTVGIIRATLPP